MKTLNSNYLKLQSIIQKHPDCHVHKDIYQILRLASFIYWRDSGRQIIKNLRNVDLCSPAIGRTRRNDENATSLMRIGGINKSNMQFKFRFINILGLVLVMLGMATGKVWARVVTFDTSSDVVATASCGISSNTDKRMAVFVQDQPAINEIGSITYNLTDASLISNPLPFYNINSIIIDAHDHNQTFRMRFSVHVLNGSWVDVPQGWQNGSGDWTKDIDSLNGTNCSDDKVLSCAKHHKAPDSMEDCLGPISYTNINAISDKIDQIKIAIVCFAGDCEADKSHVHLGGVTIDYVDQLPCPTTMTATCNAAGDQVTIDWSAVPGAGSYNVRGNRAGSVWATLATGDFYTNPPIASTSYTSDVQTGFQYRWSIQPIRPGETVPYYAGAWACNGAAFSCVAVPLTPTPTPTPTLPPPTPTPIPEKDWNFSTPARWWPRTISRTPRLNNLRMRSSPGPSGPGFLMGRTRCSGGGSLSRALKAAPCSSPNPFLPTSWRLAPRPTLFPRVPGRPCVGPYKRCKA